MQKFDQLNSNMVAIPTENIDTDQIIPARFLKTTTKVGLGKHLFCDWRYHEDGSPRDDFALHQAHAEGAQILLAGNNFGCGSSREHAPWALMDHGFRAIISTAFADIFHNNALKNGLLPIVVDADTHKQLLSLVEEEPHTTITVNLEEQTVTLPDGRSVSFPLDAFNKVCLMEGVDQLGYLLKQEDAILAYEESHPARVNTA